jgi:hypothetical protein
MMEADYLMPDTRLDYVTFYGIPVSFTLEFPFHASTSGADYYVLHGRVTLEWEERSGMHADIAVHMSQTVREFLPGVHAKHAQAPAINAIRKSIDTQNIEFLKSGKRQPIPLSSRQFSVTTQQFVFQNPSDEELGEYLKRKVYWATKIGAAKAWIADPCEALYLARETSQLLEAAKGLADSGSLKLDDEHATATPTLMAEAGRIEAEAQRALAQIDAKHAYERGEAVIRR